MEKDDVHFRDQSQKATGDLTDSTFFDSLNPTQREQLRVLSAAFQAAANAIVITDASGTIQWINPAFTAMTGYSAAEAVGQSPRLLKSGVHDQTFYRRLWQTIESGQVWRGEITNRRKDGALYTEEQTITPVRDEGGEITHYIAIKQDVTESKEAAGRLREQHRRLATLHAISQAGIVSRPLEEMLRKTLQATLRALHVELGAIFLLQPETETLHLRAQQGLTPAMKSAVETLQIGEGTSGRAVARRELVIEQIEEYATQRLRRLLLDAGVRMLVSIPIMRDESVLGALTLLPKKEQAFSQDDWQLLKSVGNLLAQFVQNAQLHSRLEQGLADRARAEREARQRAVEAEALARAAARLNARLDLDTVLSTLCEEARAALDLPAVAVTLYNEQRETFDLAAAFGFPFPIEEQLPPVPRAVYDRNVSAFGDVDIVPDIRQSDLPQVDGLEFLADTSLRTCLVGTMARNGELIGILVGATLGEERQFRESQIELWRALANQGAQAVTNARLYEQAQRRLKRLRSLNAIDRTIMARHNLKQTLDLILAQIVEQLEVDAADILLLQHSTGQLRHAAVQGFRTEGLPETPLAPGEGLAGRAVKERRVLYVPRLEKSSGFAQAERMSVEGFVSYLCVPLVSDGRVIGVLGIFHRTLLEPDSEWMAYLEMLATQVAIAVDNARLFSATRQLLKRTQAQAEQIKQIVESVPEGVLLLDHQKRIVLANPVARDYLQRLADGVGQGQLLTQLGGKPVEHFLIPTATNAPWHELRPDGWRCVFEIASRKLREGPQAGGWVMVLLDVTEERAQQERFQAQQRLASIGQLAAGIAHDFNNIMAVITLYSEALENDPDLPMRGRYLRSINEQAHHASNLIGQILDFSRSSVLERRRMDLKPFFKEVVKMLQRTLPESIVISLEVEPGEYIIRGDPTRLQQVLMNLAVNARDAMPEGGTLQLSLSALHLSEGEEPPLPELEPGDWVRLVVTDSGSGISQEALNHIFEPFFTTKSQEQGTGLGLAQVYGIVKQHGGEIDVFAEAIRGTTFTIYLPALTLSHPESEAQQPTLLPEYTPGDHTLLLVEDSEATRSAIAETLRGKGFEIISAGNGAEALAAFRTHGDEISLVLSDIVMPEMGGFELYERLRRQNPDVKFIFLSGYAHGNKAREEIASGSVLWLEKPFSIDRLLEIVQEALTAS